MSCVFESIESNQLQCKRDLGLNLQRLLSNFFENTARSWLKSHGTSWKFRIKSSMMIIQMLWFWCRKSIFLSRHSTWKLKLFVEFSVKYYIIYVKLICQWYILQAILFQQNYTFAKIYYFFSFSFTLKYVTHFISIVSSFFVSFPIMNWFFFVNICLFII